MRYNIWFPCLFLQIVKTWETNVSNLRSNVFSTLIVFLLTVFIAIVLGSYSVLSSHLAIPWEWLLNTGSTVLKPSLLELYWTMSPLLVQVNDLTGFLDHIFFSQCSWNCLNWRAAKEFCCFFHFAFAFRKFVKNSWIPFITQQCTQQWQLNYMYVIFMWSVT